MRASSSSSTKNNPQSAPVRKLYEYFHTTAADMTGNKLNGWGKEGWLVVYLKHDGKNWTIIMAREII